jgi:arylsulfatase A-like enzyme
VRGLVAPLLTPLLLLAACDSEPEPAARHHNVLLLSADSLRTDRLALWNPAGVATPNLEALAARGALYRNSYAVTPWTAPSMVSVFTGLYPPSHGVVFRDDTTPPQLPTLARILDEAGYRIGNFTFFSEISYFRGLGLGPPPPQLLQHGREPQAFGEWLAEGEPERPFFAWIHLLDTHLPYGASGYSATEVRIPGSSGLERSQLQATVPVGSAEFVAGDRAKIQELYDQDVERLDQAVGEVLSILHREQLEEHTIVIFVADHG